MSSEDLFRHAGIPLKGKSSSLSVQTSTKEQAGTITSTEEGQFSDVKAVLVSPAALTKLISAFARDGGTNLHRSCGEGRKGESGLGRFQGSGRGERTPSNL